MFTGIITDIGRVKDVTSSGDPCFTIETRYDTAKIALGASIAHCGVCLTVIETGPGWYKVQVSEETLSVTTAKSWTVGTTLNLEQALRLGDELGGHLVSGHVDGLGTITGFNAENESIRLTIDAPAALAPFIAPKGSVTINGVSLTVNEVDNNRFGINLIPHTQAQTTFSTAKLGDAVNIEVDMLARYVARLLNKDNK